MNEDLRLARPYFVLLAIFVLGRLLQGILGVPYARGHQVFSIVILTVFSAIYYGAFSRRWRDYRLIHAMGFGTLLGLVSQLVIFALTLLSYALSLKTYFNNPVALNAGWTAESVAFSQAMLTRTGGLVGNSIFAGIAGAIGWTLGGLLPDR
ncbi:MAG TPA: hypothetical protein VEQ10_16890 [Vicinamibacteria bacterium]|nr:hypothetical protein [Vicinamibacteria bacterium]